MIWNELMNIFQLVTSVFINCTSFSRDIDDITDIDPNFHCSIGKYFDNVIIADWNVQTRKWGFGVAFSWLQQKFQHRVYRHFLYLSTKVLRVVFFRNTVIQSRLLFITSFCGHLSCYHQRMASIVSQIVVVLVNRKLSDGSVNWPWVRRRNLPQYSVMVHQSKSFFLVSHS